MSQLKAWRLERGLSQLELSQASGIARWVVQLTEQNLHIPAPNQIEALARTLGVKPNELLKQQGKENEI